MADEIVEIHIQPSEVHYEKKVVQAVQKFQANMHGEAGALPVVQRARVVHLRGGDGAVIHAGMHRFNRALPVQRLGEERGPRAGRGDAERQADFVGVAVKRFVDLAAGEGFPLFAAWRRQKQRTFSLGAGAALSLGSAEGLSFGSGTGSCAGAAATL